jgi:GIY-YIG catalytic domain
MTIGSPVRKSYPFTSHEGRVKALTSPSVRKKTRGTIYLITHIDKDEQYVGKTTAAPASRMYSHVFNANHPEKLAGRRRLSVALRRSPKKFRYRVLKTNISGSKLSKYERMYIKKIAPSLNMAGGGGGGVSASSCSTPPPSSPKVQMFATPEKTYPVRIRRGLVKVILTPNGGSKNNVIYVFKNEITGKRLVGRTGQRLRRRVYQYHWSINSEKSDQRHRPFVKDIRQFPGDFSFGILAESNTPSNLDDLEEKCIERKDSQKNGYNANKGGGGSTVS